MRWHEHESYLCSDSPPISSGSLLDFQRRRSRGHDPGVLLAPRLLPLSEKKWYLKVDFWLLCFSLWQSILVLQRGMAVRSSFRLLSISSLVRTTRNSSWKISRKRTMILEQKKDISTCTRTPASLIHRPTQRGTPISPPPAPHHMQPPSPT